MITYLHATLYTGQEIIQDGYLQVADHLIVALGRADQWDGKGDVVDCNQLNIAPALIDLQIYGGGGKLFNNEPTADTINATYAAVRAGGAHFFQITLSCSPPEVMWRAFDACREYRQSGGKGLLGLHLEGPFFNPEKRGAHPLHYLQKPTPEKVSELLQRGQDALSFITLAPEITDHATLQLLLNSNVIVSAGHSNATYREAAQGFEQGISCSTHLFNGMSPLQGRAPGMVGAIYQYRPFTSFIADGIHCDFSALQISKQILGDRLFLITDAVTESEGADYKFRFNKNHYVNETGTLAGSSLSMWDAVRNAVREAGISIDEALRMGSLYPARAIRQSENKGQLKPGFPAALIAFDQALNRREI
jgi:N-acetylglucosamine-6-phosphate deacetylase